MGQILLLAVTYNVISCLGGSLSTIDSTSNKVNIDISFPTSPEKDKCVEISLWGKGIQDKFLEPCSENGAATVNTGDIFVMGNPRVNSVAFFSNQPNTLLVIKNKICTKRTYTSTNGLTTSVKSSITLVKCNYLRNKIANILGHDGGKEIIQLMQPAASTAFGSNAFYHHTSAINTPLQKNDVNMFRPPFSATFSGQNIPRYEVSMTELKDSFNIKGCVKYVSVQGKGVAEHFLVPCFKDATSVSSEDVMVFGRPTSPLGLYSDTPSVLVVLNDGVCFERRYSPIPTTPALMERSICEDVKEKMAAVIRKYPADSYGGVFKLPSFSLEPPHPVEDVEYPSPSDELKVDSDGAPGNTEGTVMELELTGVINREGDFNKARSVGYTIKPSKTSDDRCKIIILGKGVNDEFTGDCDKFGENLQQIIKNNILVVANPFTNIGFFSNKFDELVVVKDGKCYKRNYSTLYNTKNPKIIATSMSIKDCEEVKEIMSSFLGTNFGQTNPSLTTPIWRKGNYNNVRSDGIIVTLDKVENGQCRITIVGRGVNDEFKDGCDKIGEVEKIIKSHILVAANPSKNIGFYSNSYNALVIVNNGECSKKEYETSYITGNTKITPSSMNDKQCEEVKETMSSYLGTNFGQSTPITASTPIWRKGNYNAVKSGTFSVTSGKDKDGQCKLVIVGRGVNDELQSICDQTGENLEKIVKNHILVVADTSKNIGVFSDSFNELVIVNDGGCIKKEYETFSITGNTKIKPRVINDKKCEEVKETMSSYLGTNFGESTPTPSTPIWRKGNYNAVKSGTFSVTTGKDIDGQCKLIVVGRGVNDELKNICDQTGENVAKIIKNHILVIADTSKNIGVFSDSFNKLVIVNDGGCLKKEYETSSITGNTKITTSSITMNECEEVKETMSSYLGTNFGQPTPTPSTPIWRKGNYNSVRGSSFSVTSSKDIDGPCKITIIGRGVNDELKDSCEKIGDNVEKVIKNHILVVAKPSKNFGVFSNSYNQLVIINDGQCYKKDYETSSITGNTKIKPREINNKECEEVKETISSYLGTNFDQTALTALTPVWRKGTWSTTKSSTFSVSMQQVVAQPGQCRMYVVGRGVNDYIEDSCLVMGNIKKVTKSNTLVAGDPIRQFGVFTDSYNKLIVFKSGQCTKREYDTSSVTGNTKVTPRSMGVMECDKVREKMSSYLGMSFG